MKKDVSNLCNLLKFTLAEKKIANICKSGFFSIADLSKDASLSRMTVHDNLKSIKSRGLLLTKKNGDRTLYGMRDISEVVEVCEAANLQGSQVKVLYGKESLMRVWQEVSLLPPLTRACLLQSQLSIKESVKKIPKDFIEQLHKEHIKRNIIIDAIASDGIYNLLKNNLSNIAFSTMKGRSAEMNLISESLFKNTTTEMIILPKKAFLCDWKKEVCVEIEQRDIVEFLKALFEICKLTAKKVDHNRVMEAYLGE